MVKLFASLGFGLILLVQPGDRFKRYRVVESYANQAGVLIVPVYGENNEVCEISIEKRHESNDVIDVNPTLSKEQIVSLFDELVPKEERGGPGWKLPEGTEFTDVDSGTRATHVIYEKLSLVMYGGEHSERYSIAVISWKDPKCKGAASR